MNDFCTKAMLNMHCNDKKMTISLENNSMKGPGSATIK